MIQRFFVGSKAEAEQRALAFRTEYDRYGDELFDDFTEHYDECLETLKVMDGHHKVWVQYTYIVPPEAYEEDPFTLERPDYTRIAECRMILDRHNAEIVYDESGYDPEEDDYNTFHEDMRFKADFEGVHFEGNGGLINGKYLWAIAYASGEGFDNLEIESKAYNQEVMTEYEARRKAEYNTNS